MWLRWKNKEIRNKNENKKGKKKLLRFKTKVRMLCESMSRYYVKEEEEEEETDERAWWNCDLSELQAERKITMKWDKRFHTSIIKGRQTESYNLQYSMDWLLYFASHEKISFLFSQGQRNRFLVEKFTNVKSEVQGNMYGWLPNSFQSVIAYCSSSSQNLLRLVFFFFVVHFSSQSLLGLIFMLINRAYFIS